MILKLLVRLVRSRVLESHHAGSHEGVDELNMIDFKHFVSRFSCFVGSRLASHNMLADHPSIQGHGHPK